jgi:hypothetical protein
MGPLENQVRPQLYEGSVRAVSSDLGEVLYHKAARSLRLQREALAKQIGRFDSNPQRDSPCCRDRNALSARSKRAQARRWILDEMIRQASRITSSAADHVLGLEKCLEGKPEAQFCTMTLGRGVLDAATRVCYLLDPVIALDLRLLRGAALLLDSSEEEVTAVGDLPPYEAPMPHAQKVVTSIRDNVQGWINLAGMDIRTGPKRKPNGIAWDMASKSVPLKINVSSESAKYFSDIPAAYRMSSGVAHGMPWMLHDPDDRPSSVLMAQAAALAALGGCIKIGQRYAGYYGHDFSRDEDLGMVRCKAITLAAHDYVQAGNHSVGRYISDPRLQRPPSP